MEYENGKMYDVPLSELSENPDQPRKGFDVSALEALKNSIKDHGLLQPILVKESNDGSVIIVSGERRFRACKDLKKESIAAWFTDGDPKKLALIENLIRDDLTPMETSNALKALEETYPKDRGALASAIGKSQSLVSEILSLQDLPENFRTEIVGSKDYALRRLKKIAVCKNKEEQRRMCDAYKEQVEAKKNNTKRARAKGKDLVAKKIEGMAEQMQALIEKSEALELNDIQLQAMRSIKSSLDGLVSKIKGL
ncbi:ParB/RepB/Spo0J family partition protein [Candidatus Saccharibacteria bacterium]|nr:ParB/RepB/Spo0J family partition protein [Candidatus Saccharibacteria bacterium]